MFLLGVAIMVVGLAVSIGLHEIGHLVPAKLFGVKVTQYMIGFGKTLWSRKRGETEYGIKMIPLGGYIAMIGMFPPVKSGGGMRTASTGFFNTLVQDGAGDTVPVKRGFTGSLVDDARRASADTIGEGEDHRAFYRLPVWKRVIVMAGGPFMNLLIAVVLFAILLMGFGQVMPSTTIGSVSECALPATSTSQACAAADPKAPAAVAGIKPGDTLVSIDGVPITSWNQSTALIRDASGRTLSVVVNRDGAQQTLALTPLLTERYALDAEGNVINGADGKPELQNVGFVGIGPASELVRQPVTAVLPAVGENIAAVGNMILHLPQRLVDVANAAFSTAPRDPNGPISVVGVGRVAGEIAMINTIPVMDKVYSFIGLLASLNVALLVFNLIPLMPLDGGHIAGALWEGIRRWFAKVFKRRDPGPVDTAKLMPITFAVVAVLGAMSLLLMYADIVKPINFFG